MNNYETRSHSVQPVIKGIIYLAGSEVMTVKEYLELITETILGGMELEMVDGPESQDVIVKASKAPFALLTFRQYLSTLTF